MKKGFTMFGTLALGCLAMTATAGVRNQMASDAKVSESKTMTVCNMADVAGAYADKAAGFKTIEDVAGDYDVAFVGLLQNMTGPQSATWTVTVTDAAKGEVEVKTLNSFSPFKAIVDLSANTFSIPNKQKLGEDSDGPIYLYFKDADEQTGSLIDGASEIESLTGTISGTAITFPELSVWALGDFDNELLGWYILGYSFSMTSVSAQGDPNEGWSSFGTASFTDGWLCPSYDISGASSTWKVNVQRNDADKALFRLVNPYGTEGSPFVEMVDAKGGYVVFSIKNPDFVEVLDKQYCGMTVSGAKIYNTNIEGFYLAQGATSEEIITNIPDIKTWSTYKDKVVDIPTARFTIGDGKLYGWSDENNQSLAHLMKSKIVFDRDPEGDSGVESLEYDADAPVEYFTLQGVRVQNPERGTLVIKRQGSKVCKTVVR